LIYRLEADLPLEPFPNAADKSVIRLEGTMSSRTIFLSRLIGLYCIVIALSMMTRRQATVETVTALLQNSSMMLIVGIITLAAGLAMVLAHNIWSGGTLAVIVTLVGWMTLIKRSRACSSCSCHQS